MPASAGSPWTSAGRAGSSAGLPSAASRTRCTASGTASEPFPRHRQRPSQWTEKASMSDPEVQAILELTRKLHRDREAAVEEFVPGVTPILPSGAVLDEDDRAALVEQALNLRIASGAAALRFERLFAKTIGVRKAHLTNSGSS